jgi:hypothetical protein
VTSKSSCLELLEAVGVRLLFESRLSERCVTVMEKWVFAAVKKCDHGHIGYEAACGFVGGY